MSLKFNTKNSYLIALLGILTYITCIGVGMFFFAGGTKDNPNLRGYTFWFNTLSDLGRVTAYSGRANLISMILFSIAYLTIAIAMIPFYLAFPYLFENTTYGKRLTKLGGFLGIVSSVGFIGVVLTPADILYAPHMFFAIMAYVAILFMSVAYTTALYMNDHFENYYTYLLSIFCLIFFVFLMMALTSLTLGVRSLLTIGQKIGRISILVCYSILIYKSSKLV
ncbi:MAG: hypothetical protein GF353_23865 [Candidatus Lokiarchaeota archaeon]|nr:hypothetical protein [Candidatus Lokiarchaeota archaeon]